MRSRYRSVCPMSKFTVLYAGRSISQNVVIVLSKLINLPSNLYSKYVFCLISIRLASSSVHPLSPSYRVPLTKPFGSSGSELTATSEQDTVETVNGGFSPIAPEADSATRNAKTVKHVISDDDEEGVEQQQQHVDEEKPPLQHGDPTAAGEAAVNVSEGWRYFLASGSVSCMGISLLAFFLTLAIWNTWRAVTYIVSPLPESIGLRCSINLAFCAFAFGIGLLGTMWAHDFARGLKVLGNVLGGIGLWELIESLVSYSTNVDSQIDLCIYGGLLVFCSIMVFILYKYRNINIIESSLLSPV